MLSMLRTRQLQFKSIDISICFVIKYFQSSNPPLEATQHLFDVYNKELVDVILGIKYTLRNNWDKLQKHHKWLSLLTQFSSKASDMIKYPIGIEGSMIQKDYFEKEMKKALEKNVCDQKDYEDVISKCTISITYSTEIRAFAKALPNYDKLAKLFSKEQRDSWNRLAIKLEDKNLANFDPTKQEPKIFEFLKAKNARMNALYDDILNFFKTKLKALTTRSEKAQKAWWHLNYVDRNYDYYPERTKEEKMARGKDAYSEFSPILHECTSLMDEKGVEEVKAEMTKEFPAMGKYFQSMHDVFIGFPSAMCDFIDAMKNSAKKSKSERKG